jgi:hypothetical protein
MSQKPIVYKYSFVLGTGETKEIELCLDAKTLNIVNPPRVKDLPDWTILKYRQCCNCSLDSNIYAHCPIAVNILTLSDTFTEFSSYQPTKVCVETDSRFYTKETDLQTALSSLLGIYMVTSGCPIMDKLRPMVRFHLPFSSYDETRYRAISMYLVGQYLRYKKGKKPDWDLKGFVKMYEEIKKVNRGFNERLQDVNHANANTFALVILDSFASLITFDVEDISEDLDLMFKQILTEP